MSASPEAIGLLTRRFLLDHPARAARVAQALPVDEVAAMLSGQPAGAVGAMWPWLAPHYADALLPRLAEPLAGALLTQMDAPDAGHVLSRLREAERERCLALVDSDYAKQLRDLLAYPPDTAGRVMEPRIFRFHGEATAFEALTVLRRDKPRGVREVYIVDTGSRLQGAVDIETLAIADSHQTLASLARAPHAAVSPFDPLDEVTRQLREHRLDVLPVVDVGGRLLGAIPHATLLRALEEESLIDVQTMVGAGREERALSPVGLAVRKRLAWMQVNLVTAFVAASVVGLFEGTIARFTALAVLLPVVAGQAGNAGAQALAVTIRGLALREVTARNWPRILVKETGVGLINGVAVAVTTAAGVYLWSRNAGLVLVIVIAMVVSMIIAGMAGALVPLILTRLGQDPAQSSSIVLTTVTDVSGFLSFLGIATLLASLL